MVLEFAPPKALDFLADSFWCVTRPERTVSERKTSPYLTVREAAEFLRLRPRTLDNMRWRGIGPKYRKHGGRIVYDVNDLIDWSRGNSRPRGA